MYKIQDFEKAFQTKYLSGSARYYGGKNEKKVGIKFNQDSKIYFYTKINFAELLERFDLLPEVDFFVESEKIVNQLLSGESEVISLAGFGDTMRSLHGDKIPHNKIFTSECTGKKDIFNRSLYRYFIENKPAWLMDF